MQPLRKPVLPSGFLTWTEPPDAAGDEILRLVSWRRALTLKGHSFRELARTVLPLLDGTRTSDEIAAQTADLFARADLEAALATLAGQGILAEGDDPTRAGLPERLVPQANYLDELSADGPAAQRRLAAARVAVLGLGGAGAPLARTLAAAGVGQLLLVDPYPVGPTDPYFSALFAPEDLGGSRAETLAARLSALAPEVRSETATQRPEDPAALAALLAGTDLAVCCLESGDLNLALKLNRACRDLGLRWLAGSLEGPVAVAGPGFPPASTGPGSAATTSAAPCYMCWRMREVACAGNPQSRFALERRLDRIRADLGARREGLAPAADLLAGLLGTEVLNILSGIAEPALDGRVITLDLAALRQERHNVLRKPGCPVCGGGTAP